MSQRFFLPVFRLDVSYNVRHGRRWSVLEHLVLWACKNPVSAPALADQAKVSVRLISECLVNLLRAGWVELRTTQTGTMFAATASGVRAAEKPMLDHLLEIRRKTTQVYRERLTGEVFSQDELTLIRRHQAGFQEQATLPPNVFSPAVFGPELVDRLYFGPDDTFERFLETPHMVPGDLFAVLDVDAQSISGLPPRTPASVGIAVVEAIRRARVVQASELMTGTPVPTVEAGLGCPLRARGQMRPFSFQPDDIVVGGPEHLACALDVIRRARRLVVVHSTFVGKNIRHLLPALSEAATAGARVHLHWGKSDDPEGVEANPSEVAARLAVSSLPADARKNICLGSVTSGSHAKIILADSGSEGGYVAAVGSCNWLDSPFQSIEASIRTADPGMVSIIALKMASVLAPALGQDVVVSRLLDVHGECATQPVADGAHAAMLVADEDHYAAVRDAMRDVGAGGTVSLGSHKFGHAGETTVFDPMRAAARQGAKVRLFYTRALPGLDGEALVARRTELAGAGVDLSKSAEPMHAKFLAWGDSLLVTSFNLLSASVNGRHRRGGEVGILLTGPNVVQEFEARLTAKGGDFVEPDEGTQPRRRRRRRKQMA